MNSISHKQTKQVVSRLCHDLSNPIGAIANGLELLQMRTKSDEPELALINESLENASARLLFLRYAFGSVHPDKILSQQAVQDCLDRMARFNKLDYDWRSLADVPMPWVQTLFLAIACCERALPFGGHIAVDFSGTTWVITATGPSLRVDPHLWDGLTADKELEAAPSDIQFSCLAPEFKTHKGKVHVTPDTISLSLTL